VPKDSHAVVPVPAVFEPIETLPLLAVAQAAVPFRVAPVPAVYCAHAAEEVNKAPRATAAAAEPTLDPLRLPRALEISETATQVPRSSL
jgi:hypothetical protein